MHEVFFPVIFFDFYYLKARKLFIFIRSHFFRSTSVLFLFYTNLNGLSVLPGQKTYIRRLKYFFRTSYSINVLCVEETFTAQKMKFSIKDFFSKCDQIRRKLLLKKSLMKNFIFCVVIIAYIG